MFTTGASSNIHSLKTASLQSALPGLAELVPIPLPCLSVLTTTSASLSSQLHSTQAERPDRLILAFCVSLCPSVFSPYSPHPSQVHPRAVSGPSLSAISAALRQVWEHSVSPQCILRSCQSLGRGWGIRHKVKCRGLVHPRAQLSTLLRDTTV